MKKNPLKDCKTIREVFSTIRKICEDLRGKRFRYWETTWFIYEGTLRISIDSDETRIPGGSCGTVSWSDIFRGDRLYDWPRYTRTYKHGRAGGYEVIKIGSGTSGAHSNTVKYHGSIGLAHLPHIRRLLEKNKRTAARMPLEVAKDPHVRAITLLLQPLQKQVRITEQELRKHEARAAVEYKRKHPTINVLTGKPEVA